MTQAEAIRRIKAWNLDSDDMEVLATIIPELRESEDENLKNKSGYYKDGKFWKASTLWNATKNKIPQRVSNRYILQECTWNIGTLQRFADEVKNVQEVSLDYPIILDMNGNILDGAHRVVKAYLEGKDIDIVYLGDDEWPEPDYDEEKAVKESEDERIRKALIDLVSTVGEYYLKSDSRSKMLLYLEKQEENPSAADSIPSDCTAGAKCEDRWHKVEDSLPDNPREVLCKDEAGNYFIGRYYTGEGWEISNYDDEDKPHHLNPPVSKWIDFPSEKQKEQKPVRTAKQVWKEMRLEVYAQASGNRHEPNCSDNSTKMFSLYDIDEIFEKIGDSTVGPQKPIECIEFDNEFEKQVSHLLASVLNGEWEYNEGFVKHVAQSLLGYAKNELKPVPFSCGHENGKSTEWAELQSEFKNINEAFEDGKKEVIDHPDKYGLTKQKTPDSVFSKQEYESHPIISTDTTSVKPVEFDGKTLLYTADKSYQIGFRDGVASVKQEWSKVTINGEPIPTETKSVDIPLAEWSDEDKKMIERIVETIQDYAMETGQIDEETGGTKEPLISYINFLRSLRPQPKQEWSEEDEKMLKWLCRIIHSRVVNKELSLAEESDLGKWIDKWINYEPQPVQKWDEFDEDCLKRAIWYVENPAPSVVKDTNLVLWLQSLSERFNLQPKQEWSEEDERRRDGIIQWLREYQKEFNPKYDSLSIESIESLIDWLKSLRPQSQGIYQQVVKGIRDMCDRYEQNGMFTDERARDFLGNVRVKCKDAIECAPILDEPSWKPSEQEKGALRTAIYVLTEERNFPKAAAQLQNILNAFEGKESRKDWKPSEKQMDSLRDTIVNTKGYSYSIYLPELYEQLKKL